jgi:hypothetical protein
MPGARYRAARTQNVTAVDTDAVLRFLGIDLTNPDVRQRAWRRLRLFKEMASEFEADGNHKMAAFMRQICAGATGTEQDLICLAMLAGVENPEADES